MQSSYPVHTCMNTTPKDMLPIRKRISKGAAKIVDANKPQIGDVIVVYFGGSQHTGTVVNAVITSDGDRYSVNYKSGFVTRDDKLDGYTWRFHSTSPKAIKKDRKPRRKWTGPAVTTGRVRKNVAHFKAESATSDNKSKLRSSSDLSIDIDDTDDEEEVIEVDAYEVFCKSDDDDDSEYVLDCVIEA